MTHIVYPETGSPLSAPDFFYARHCPSEGNALFEEVCSQDREARERAYQRLSAQTLRYWDYESPLTPSGCVQARITGIWLKTHRDENARTGRPSKPPGSTRRTPPPFFDYRLVSPLRRPTETAACFGLQEIFETEPLIAEQSFGKRAYLGPVLLQERYPEEYEAWRRDPFRFQPLGGESIEDLVNGRIREAIVKMTRRQARRILIVGHSEAFRAFQYRFECMTPEAFRTAYFDPANALGYGEIMHYTQINPRTKRFDPEGLWARKISPRVNRTETVITGWREIQLPQLPPCSERRRSRPPSDPPEARESAP